MRVKRIDHDGPHQVFEVMIHQNENRMRVRACNLDEKKDYFEINVRSKEEIKKVLEQFENDYSKLAQNLRIMTDVMVLLNPVSISP